MHTLYSKIPWSLTHEPEAKTYTIRDPDGAVIAILPYVKPRTPKILGPVQQQYNAYLLHASAILLQACQGVCTSLGFGSQFVVAEFHQVMQSAVKMALTGVPGEIPDERRV